MITVTISLPVLLKITLHSMPLISISISVLDAQQCNSKNSLIQTDISGSLDEGHCDNGFGDRLNSMDLGL